MSEPSLDLLGDCLEGMVPSSIATVDPDGVPNVSLISQVHYVDPERVALSYQFFNKTRANVLATGRATVGMIDPATMTEYRLALSYEETRTEGPLFESMKAKLAGIASHTGMGGVFRLLGADVFRVERIGSAPGPRITPPPPARNLLAATRRACAELAAESDLGGLLDTALDGLDRHFGIEHAMLLLVDEEGRRLYTVASHGYDRSGIGSELAVGQGVVGVAARERVPIRIGHMTADTDYGTAVRDQARRHGMDWEEATEIPFPGLDAPESQIAVPIVCGGRTVGVLFGESGEPLRFRQDDEDALTLVADRLGALIPEVQQNEDASEPEAAGAMAGQAPIVVRHYAADDSIFLGHDYLIKGVAGAIFWKLVREHLEAGRVEFTNRELRLDPSLRLPEHAENLEARLLLLQRRLRERESPIRIEKAGRGRLRLGVPAPLTLEEIGAGGA
ncbi:MAG TPA: GAF domain-containing protein [Amaricoccus sp.]|nr:GAF domain-containing protein [Amaricoccus sp.]